MLNGLNRKISGLDSQKVAAYTCNTKYYTAFMREVINISLPAPMAKAVRAEVKQGQFASVSEFFRHILRERKATELLAARDKFNRGGGKILRSLRDLK